MAEEDKNTESQENQEGRQEQTEQKAKGGYLLPLIILAIVVPVCAAAGFGLSRLFGSPAEDKSAEQSQSAADEPTANVPDVSGTGPEQGWFYDLEPVVGFLDEPGATRYLRAQLTLKLGPETSRAKFEAYLTEKKPVLTNWLSIYLASLSIDDIRGDKNQRRIQSEILDAFNEKLFPDGKACIQAILFKEFIPQ